MNPKRTSVKGSTNPPINGSYGSIETLGNPTKKMHTMLILCCMYKVMLK